MNSAVSQMPADLISGLELDDGWVVGDRLQTGRAGGGTGGNFSVSYLVKKGERTAFLKAFDLMRPMQNAQQQGHDVMAVMQALTQAYSFEARLHEICNSGNLRKIVRVLGKGQVVAPVDSAVVSFNVVPYLILEFADGGDVRSYISRMAELDISIKLEFLKDIAVGIQQLHKAQIAHQDIKPSNVMIFGADGAKIGDLGRASSQVHASLVDGLSIAGDPVYAPPEQCYGVELIEWIDRRQRCDLYQFGSLICYLFFGSPINAMMYSRLPVDIAPAMWRGNGQSYKIALPYLQQAFGEAIDSCKGALPQWLQDPIVDLIKQAGNPDYTARGSKRTVMLANVTIGMDRFISDLDLLSKKAVLEYRKSLAKA